MVDRVAVDDSVLGSQILVLPIVILDRDREADRRIAQLLERDVIAPAAEPVGAPDLANVEAGTTTTVNLPLEVGELGETITVAGAAPATRS